MSIFEKSKGTPKDPFKIYTEDDLRELINFSGVNNPEYHYQLQNDITMKEEWTEPIALSSSTPFSGTFDGNGYAIKDLVSPNGNGLFFYSGGSTIKNLGIENAKMYPQANYSSPLINRTIAGSAGRLTTIKNCYVDGVEIDSGSQDIYGHGAFIGWMYQGDADILGAYVKDVSITVIGTPTRPSGAIVGYIQNRRLSFDNVLVLGDIELHGYSTQRPTLYHGWNNGGTVTGSVIQATTSSTHDLSASERTQTPLVKDSYPNTVSFGPEQVWDMVDGELPFLTYLGTRVNPRKISVKEDLSLIDEFSYDYFELVNDIEVNTRYNSYVFVNDFYGTISGNGYGLYGIDLYNTSTSAYIALFYRFYGHMKDIIIDMDRVYVGTNTRGQRGRASALAYDFSGTIRDVRVSVRTLRGGTTNNGLLGYISEGADVKNCFLYVGTLDIYSSTASILGGLSNSSVQNGYDITIENNIFHINNIKTSNANFVTSTNESIKNNVLYVGSGRASTNTGQQIRVSSLSDFRNPDNSAYNSFDKDKWVFRDGEDPIQSVFIKITEKIEERLISLYSKGMYLESKWTKGFKNILNFFTNKSGSSTRTKRSPFRRLLNFTKDISLSMLFKKRGRKRVKTNSGLVVSNITKLKKLTETILSYSNKITSDYSKMKSGAKILEIYSDKVSSRTTEIKKSLKKAVNYSKGIRDNLLKKITRRHNRKTQSFSGNIGSDVFHSYLTRMTEIVMSYSGHMRSIIRRASNKYDLEFRMVSNQANRISIKFKRFIRTMRTTRSHSGMITTFIRKLSKISAPTEIFARAVARTNIIKMRVKESFTKIRASNGGGD